MADNTTLNSGTGGDTISTDDIGAGVKVQRVKAQFGGDGSATDVSHTNPLPVEGGDAENAAATANPIMAGGRYDATPRTLGDGDAGAIALDADGAVHISDGGNTITVDGTVTANLSATDNAVLDTIETNTDYGTVTGGGVEASALRVTLANDSTGVLSVDDNGSTLSVDDGGSTLSIDDGGASVTVDHTQLDLLHSEDFDTGAGTDNTAAIGIAIPSNSGAVAVDSTNPLPIDVQFGAAQAATNTGNSNANTQRVVLATDQPVVSVDDNGGSLTIDGTVTANLSATDNAVLDTIETNTDYGTVTGGGVEASALRVTIANDSTGVLSIDDNGGAITVDNGGTFAVQAASAGDVAHDSADSGNPVKVGGKAKNYDGSAPGTAVAEDDRADFVTDVYGRQFVEISHPNYWSASADYASAQTNTTVKAAPGAGLKLYVTDVIVSNGATAGNITLLDGSGGTVLLELYPAINGGLTHSFRTPIALTANTLLAITSTTVTTHSVTVSGYIAP